MSHPAPALNEGDKGTLASSTATGHKTNRRQAATAYSQHSSNESCDLSRTPTSHHLPPKMGCGADLPPLMTLGGTMIFVIKFAKFSQVLKPCVML
jgi:hypothetical protein